MLAIKWWAESFLGRQKMMSICHWHVYLADSPLILMSDHNPLTHFRQQKDLCEKFGQWITELEENNCSIQYIPRKKNMKVDTLSRKSSKKEWQPNFLKTKCINLQELQISNFS